MNRRHFLQTAVAGTASKSTKRPNILFAIADDWSWPFASIAGDRSVRTPAFDRIAREGVLFPHAYTVAPTCTASRGAVLTGQWFARLQQGANLWSSLPAKFDVYPDLLEASGYLVGYTGKGWGPGNFEAGGRKRNPAGPEYSERKAKPPASGMSANDYAANFSDFLRKRNGGQPFCFWYGGIEPHRVYEAGSGLRSGKQLGDVRVPRCLPDAPEVRSDLLDYALEIDWFDTHLGRMLQTLEQAGELEDTVIAVTGDNGLPFPRCKANLYGCGTNVPLAVRWGKAVPKGRTVEDFVSLSDLAPTFLEAAGLKPTAGMTGRSLLDMLRSGKSGFVDRRRSQVFTGRERHTQAQPDGGGGYPSRALRTRDFLYVRNYHPERRPAGYDTGKADAFRDIDAGPAKTYMLANRSAAPVANLFELAVGKRPAEELYDLRSDPGELRNVAGEAAFREVKKKMAADLQKQLKDWADPRALDTGDEFDGYEYFGKY